MGVGSRLGKILIANRGEIACRVIRSAKQLGVKTVVVYSQADSSSVHVRMADEAYNVGPPPAQDSYLRGDRIIEIAKKAGAVAIHPGYGFLSENAEFAKLCKDSGIIFIGPPHTAIRDMGIKSTSKQIMLAAGVSVIPGYHGEDQSDTKLSEEAIKIGFPLMIKAVRGGGGKGMRIANSESEFQSALDSARRESLRAFGDQAVLLEKYVLRPRHIEVQIFGDTHGNYVYLFERDCSVQRRHQKVIEQAPAPGISDSLRKELGEAAVQAAKAVKYVGAGTVEFIMDTNTSAFYFMEMNTRLQVEHPVTEMITGLDLVEWQLRIASGEKIPLIQDQIKFQGHALEARVYAEDVYKGFMPTAGTLEKLSIPQKADDVRIETGVVQGDSVSVHYDPMIAKVIVWDHDPKGVFDKLENTLQEFNIVGVENNVDFLRNLCKNNDLISGNVHTGFIEQHKQSLLEREPSELIITMVTLFAVLNDKQLTESDALKSSDPFSPFSLSNSFRLNHFQTKSIKLKHQDKDFNVTISFLQDGEFEIMIDNSEAIKVRGLVRKENGFAHLIMETCKCIVSAKLCVKDNDVYIFHKDGDFKVHVIRDWDWQDGTISSAKGSQAVSPMPGVVEKINVKEGDSVKKGDPIAVVMAMKMEHIIRAEKDGRVASVLFKPGDNIGKNVPLVKFMDN